MANPFEFPDLGNLELISGKGICDFCSPPQPSVWVYPCKTFEMPTLPGMTTAMGGRIALSDGDWGACAECAALIELADAIGLAKRCSRSGILLDMQKRIVQKFFDNRIFDQPRVSVAGQSSTVYGATIVIPSDYEPE